MSSRRLLRQTKNDFHTAKESRTTLHASYDLCPIGLACDINSPATDLPCNEQCIYCSERATDGNDYILHLQRCKTGSAKASQEDVIRAVKLRQQLLDKAWDDLGKHSGKVGRRPKKKTKRRLAPTPSPPASQDSYSSPTPAPEPSHCQASADYPDRRCSTVPGNEPGLNDNQRGDPQDCVVAPVRSSHYLADSSFQTPTEPVDAQLPIGGSLEHLLRPNFASYTMGYG
ncbi:uncharacterized protein F5Z01DRAFT_474477 [Emericellopsis atlantica]|uniref:Uncharacterized protein n=1 Tax=Emericellopsis atlantica TaxID=2614577 RepID=A0A9P7ZDJ2_9HYPO|nr:uncharacterized protein F5Z01DRAFT_474477 [Emericellopsis atlantica]KAG9249590.1 hypothetical protein F5Z01DRAFT_474477 [Emericellopsis atlantica]